MYFPSSDGSRLSSHFCSRALSIGSENTSTLLALSITDHAYFIEKGQLRFDGSSKELLERDDLLRSVFLAAR